MNARKMIFVLGSIFSTTEIICQLESPESILLQERQRLHRLHLSLLQQLNALQQKYEQKVKDLRDNPQIQIIQESIINVLNLLNTNKKHAYAKFGITNISSNPTPLLRSKIKRADAEFDISNFAYKKRLNALKKQKQTLENTLNPQISFIQKQIQTVSDKIQTTMQQHADIDSYLTSLNVAIEAEP